MHLGARAKQTIEVHDSQDENLTLALEKSTHELSSNDPLAEEELTSQTEKETFSSPWFKVTMQTLDEIFFYEETPGAAKFFLSTLLPWSTTSDIIWSPILTTNKLTGSDERVSATLRPSVWAKPNSMIAKASKLQQKNKLKLSARSSEAVSPEKSYDGATSEERVYFALASTD